MVKQTEFHFPEYPYGFHLVTHKITEQLGELPDEGILHLFIKHTSAGLTLNENADYTVRQDFETFFNCWIPENFPGIRHNYEGSDDMPAHIKSTITGQSIIIPISKGELNLGIWQGIYLCEFRHGGGRRKLTATIIF